jgi:hypothetical protein
MGEGRAMDGRRLNEAVAKAMDEGNDDDDDEEEDDEDDWLWRVKGSGAANVVSKLTVSNPSK